METLERTAAGHTETMTITKNRQGWEVRETHDNEVVRQVQYTDWHRVERARQVFEVIGDLPELAVK